MLGRNHRGANKAFTLTELLLVATIVAIIAALALPKMMAARLSAHETSAIATLRSLITAQALVQTQATIDSDADGVGEDGFFAELAGTAPVRANVGGAPSVGTHRLTPTLLSIAFGKVDSNGLVARSGYNFQIWLPGASVGGLTPGVAELPTTGGADPSQMPDAEKCATLWCCYAWPISAGRSGNRAFFVNQRGELLQCDNRAANRYTGTSKMPAFDEVFVTSGDMASKSRIGVAGGNDNTIWVPVQ
jgi:prepilin-type N-terminal cleavage/methylation domain-containing protein